MPFDCKCSLWFFFLKEPRVGLQCVMIFSGHTNKLTGISINHSDLLQAAYLKAPIDERVSEHIQKLVSENVTNTNEIQRNIKIFVKGIFGSNLPQNLNRQFFSSREDVRKIEEKIDKRQA